VRFFLLDLHYLHTTSFPCFLANDLLAFYQLKAGLFLGPQLFSFGQPPMNHSTFFPEGSNLLRSALRVGYLFFFLFRLGSLQRLGRLVADGVLVDSVFRPFKVGLGLSSLALGISFFN